MALDLWLLLLECIIPISAIALKQTFVWINANGWRFVRIVTLGFVLILGPCLLGRYNQRPAYEDFSRHAPDHRARIIRISTWSYSMLGLWALGVMRFANHEDLRKALDLDPLPST